MSVTVVSRLFVGFEVYRKDFIILKEDDVPHCPADHAQTGSDPFCSKDGGKFAIRKIEHPTKILEKLCEIHHFALPVSGERLNTFYNSLFEGSEPFLALGFHHDRRTFAGSMLSDITYGGRLSYSAIPMADVTRTIKRVEQYRIDLGVADRAIDFHHVLGSPED